MYILIVTSLISTGLHDVTSKDTNAYNYGYNVGGVDLEGFKVLTSILVHVFSALCMIICLLATNVERFSRVLPPAVVIIILGFNLIFNIAGSVCLWIHRMPNFPDHYARSSRANAVLSSTAIFFTLCTALAFCIAAPSKAAARAKKRRGSKERKGSKEDKGSKGKKDSESSEEGAKSKQKKPSSPPPEKQQQRSPDVDKKDNKESKESKESKDGKGSKEGKEGKENPEGKESKESKESKDAVPEKATPKQEESADKPKAENADKMPEPPVEKDLNAPKPEENVEGKNAPTQRTMDMTDAEYYSKT